MRHTILWADSSGPGSEIPLTFSNSFRGDGNFGTPFDRKNLQVHKHYHIWLSTYFLECASTIPYITSYKIE